ncbi:MAG: glucosyl-3-phosphoglycerate synthase [Verrucomicrobiales bacterium]|nr:glucosyl-3-phosphoglycerate synthase [Verrucomicrobiales bacterium]
MADFQQNVVPTFSLLANEDLARMEKNIVRAARRTPIGVIIPALFSDLSSPAMQHIIGVLAGLGFIKRVYISLDRSDETEFEKAREIVKPLGDKGVLLWNDAPTVQTVLEKIGQVVPLGARGKGRAVWTALGYALGRSEVAVLAFHDADILTYDRGFLLRLLYPVVHLRYQFAKGFYVRYSDRLHGRVARLFYFPFVKALRDILGKPDFLEYMADFRYPLSGEFATFTSLANDLLFPSDWGIEVGILAEMYRITRPHRICQVEITPRYDHKHQEPGTDASSGLQKMASDIARTFFTRLSAGGTILSLDLLRTLKHTYLANARSFVRIYESHAEMNSLPKFDRHLELGLIETFAAALDRAFTEFQDHLFGSPMIPEWRRIEVALEGVLPELVQAFDQSSPPAPPAAVT